MGTPIEQVPSAGMLDLDLSFLDDLPHTSASIDPSVLATFETFDASNLDHLTLTEEDPAQEWAHIMKERQMECTDYTDFESWIPEFERPAQPCDYCRSKHLECYKRKDTPECNACKCLFRECSLASTTMEASNYASDNRGTFFDALHTLDEDNSIEQGTRATIKYLKSKNTALSMDDMASNAKRNGIRFPRHAVKILRDWLEANADHPYPCEQERTRLEEITGLKTTQITNWLANARRRRKALTKTAPKRCVSPSARCPTPAIDILAPDQQWENMNPLQRWQQSPPENEPATMTDIVTAVVNSDLPDAAASTPSSMDTRRPKGSSAGSGLSARRAASTTSAETSRDSSHGSSGAYSHASSAGSFGSFGSSLAGKRDRRRKKRAVPVRQSSNDKKRMFQCTFCTDTFRSKYDWTRHEKSLHLSLEKWICAPIGPCIVDQGTGETMCVYCGLRNPPKKHEEEHNHRACEEKGIDSRTFFRKDHLRQHLRLFHGCDLKSSMDTWKFTATKLISRCGFCAQRFNTWSERADHLSGHFRAGVRMTDWRGCRGFDPYVAAQVTNAMPPYLIGIEALSPNPFSATNVEDTCQVQQNYVDMRLNNPRDDSLPAKATCWEILTVRLGRFANDRVANGIVISDEMLQAQARTILYGCDDSWNQTAADNPEWLDLFKKAHGLDYIPTVIGGQGDCVPEDLEWYQDLGMRIPFFVQLEQYNKSQKAKRIENGELRPEKQAETSLHLLHMLKQLAGEGVLHGPHVQCPHVKCSDNLINVDILRDDDAATETQQMRWCNDALTPANTGTLAKFVGLINAGNIIADPNTPTPNETEVQSRSMSSARASCLEFLRRSEESQTCDCKDGINTPSASAGKSRAACLEHLSHSDSARAANAAKARATCLEHLQHGEVNCCPFIKQNDVLGQRNDELRARQARMHALAAISRNEGRLHDGATEAPENLSVYLPYHKAVLPAARANRFATVTGAWEDSGKMPLPYSTADVSASMYGESVPVMTAMEEEEAAMYSSADIFAPVALPATTMGQEMDVMLDARFPPLTMAEISDMIEATSHDMGMDEMDFGNVFDMAVDDAYTS